MLCMNSFRPSAEHLTVAQAAAEANVTAGTIRNWIARGHLRASRLGTRTLRIRREDLNDLFKPCTGAAE